MHTFTPLWGAVLSPARMQDALCTRLLLSKKLYESSAQDVDNIIKCLQTVSTATSDQAACWFADLINVFEVFLPQLLLYPNPSDPLNGDAASLMMKDKTQYEQKVKEYCERYAKKENIIGSPKDESDEEITDEEDLSGQSDSEDEVVGHADP